mgnify:CR=1 FL=1
MAHWYDINGDTHHQVLNRAQTKLQGKIVFRDSTIADARKNGWLSGWTAIGSLCSDTEWIARWRQAEFKRVMEAERPKGKIELWEHYWDRINKVLTVERDKHMKLGSQVHKQIEFELEHETHESNCARGELKAPVRNFWRWYHANVKEVIATEETFGSESWGYGGAVDLQYLDHDGNYCIVDFKTKRTREGEKIKQGLEQKRQLVAYALGLEKITVQSLEFDEDENGYPRRPITPQDVTDGWVDDESLECPILGNLYLSTTEPDRWEYHGIDPDEIPELILDVRDCVRLWQRENKFGPYAVKK